MKKNHLPGCPCHEHDVPESDGRRRFLAAGAAAATGILLPSVHAAQSIHELQGTAFRNRELITLATQIYPGDWVTVSQGSSLVFSLGDDVYRLRGGTSMKVEADSNFVVTGLRVLTGAILGVFGHGEKTIRMRTATIGIRGTGLYIDNSPEKTYFCTCYGETEVRVPNVANQIYTAKHHNAIMIYTPANEQANIHNMAGFEGHTDDELRRNESYVGRTVPF